MAKLTRDKVPFTQVANEVLNDKRLSAKAKGLYAYLFSKPEGWNFATKRIHADFNDGEKSIISGIKELEDLGYLTRKKVSDRRMDYNLKHSSVPTAENRLLSTAEKANHLKRQPDVLGGLSNKEGISNKEEDNNKEEAKKPSGVFSLQEQIEKLEASPRREFGIIGFYFRKRSPKFENIDQCRVAVSRHIRPAKLLTSFSDGQLIKATNEVKDKYPEWTLETLIKQLTK